MTTFVNGRMADAIAEAKRQTRMIYGHDATVAGATDMMEAILLEMYITKNGPQIHELVIDEPPL